MSIPGSALREPLPVEAVDNTWLDVTVSRRERRLRRWLPGGNRTGEDALRALNPVLVAAHKPASSQAEALRELRSQLLLRWFDEKRRTLAVVGARDSEGCSSLAANLAIVLAQLGEQTLLVDADLREPRQQELFGLEPDVGVADVLLARHFFEQALIQAPAIENLTVLCAGRRPSNPQELVSGAAFIELLQLMSLRFTAIVVDTPPVLTCADAQIIAARAGGCVLVTRRHRTRLADVEAVKERLKPTGAQLLGAVING